MRYVKIYMLVIKMDYQQFCSSSLSLKSLQSFIIFSLSVKQSEFLFLSLMKTLFAHIEVLRFVTQSDSSPLTDR